MRRDVLEADCFLCGTSTPYFEFDGGKRRHYACNGINCGAYVIRDTARRRLDVAHAATWRKQAAGLAHTVCTDEQILEIWVNPSSHVLETHLINRKITVETG